MNNSEFDFIQTFPPLGNPEHHFNKYPNHPWLKTKREISNWLALNSVISIYHKFIIHDDLTVSVIPKNITQQQYRFVVDYSKSSKISYIPVQFRSVLDFVLTDSNLTTAIGTPYVCQELSLERNAINSFIGISTHIKEYINLSNNNIENFQHMPTFLHDLFLCIYNNPFKNWNYFNLNSKISKIQFGNSKFNQLEQDSLILNLPININSASILATDKYSNYLKISNSNCINMKYLESYRKTKASIEQSYNTIKKNNTIIDRENKRRKI